MLSPIAEAKAGNQNRLDIDLKTLGSSVTIRQMKPGLMIIL
jgi:hypothetical protein